VILWLASHWPWLACAAFAALCVFVPAVAGFLFGTKVGRVLLVVGLALGVGYWQRTDGYADGYRAADAHRKEWESAAALRVADANLAESEANRKAEQTRVDAMALGESQYQRGRNDEKAAVASVLADVDAGRYVLRSSLRCPRPAPEGGAGAPGPFAALGDGPAAGAGILSAEDVRAFVRLAADADGVLARAYRCKGIAEDDRKPVTP